MNTTYYKVSSENKVYSCKITTYKFPGRPETSTISFGGKSTYCIVGAWKSIEPTIVYIDRIEYDKGCILDGQLEHGKGTISMIQAALYTIRRLYPDVTQITFTDDSHIYCEHGSKKYKLSLAHDYILKYNQTWYEQKFHAKLPLNLYQSFQSSLSVLDEPLSPFEFQVTLSPYLEQYKQQYMSASTPRDFFTTLRNDFGTRYCVEVWHWIRHYLEQQLHIKVYKDSWSIDTSTIQPPHEYQLDKTTQQGGSRKRYTRKMRKYEEEYMVEQGLGLYGDW